MKPPLLMNGIAKSMPGGRLLFSDVALEVSAGEQVAIFGESGIGKSTLLNLAAGLDEPDTGEVDLGGISLGSLDDAGRTRLRRQQIGFVFQAFHILPHLTLGQNVALPLLLLGSRRHDALARAAELLGSVGLGDRFDSFPKEISGGEMQRVAIARALVHAPPLILADEPTGNLDPSTAAEVMQLLNRSVKEHGSALLLVTHSPLAASAADRRLLLTQKGLSDG